MKRISILLVAATSFAVPACTSDGPTGGGDDGSGSGSGSADEWDTLLGTREYDYNAALKIAALRLTGDAPTMDEIMGVQNAPDLAAKKAAYETQIRAYMARPTFTRQMMAFWRDTFKMGETAELDAAPAFATQLSVDNRSYLELFTATTGNCPTIDAGLTTVTAANCTGTGPQAGVLTNQGAMKQFYSNFAFRRVRWVQETFDCAKFPIEISPTPTDVGGAAPYIGVWPFQSISGLSTGRVNFQDVSAVVCANCHQSLNHIAPLFANFDIMGAYKTTISVPTPLDNAPMAQLTDYLPPTETTAWRYQVPAADLPSLGMAMAGDKAVQTCGVARIWNWALGKTDIVDTLQEVPADTIQAQVDAFAANGFKMKDLIYAVYTADDFVKF